MIAQGSWFATPWKISLRSDASVHWHLFYFSLLRQNGRVVKDSISRCFGVRFLGCASGVAGKLLAFLWGSGELPRTTSCGISPISFLPRESRSFPTTPIEVGEKRTQIHSSSIFQNNSFLVEKGPIAIIRIHVLF